MKQKETMKTTWEQEKEIMNILIDSSLYQEMSQAERQKVLNYLVSSYFALLPVVDRRALPVAMQNGSAM